MIGLASLADAPVTLTGQKYFQRRPVGPLLDALAQLGVAWSPRTPRRRSPSSRRGRRGGHVRIAGTLSQWISGLLLLAPFATRPTVVEVDGVLNEQPYVELTVRMMRDFGLEVGVSDDWRRFEIEPGQEATPTEIALPPDIGSAAFGLAATALHPVRRPLPGDAHDARHARSTTPRRTSSTCVAEMGLPMELDARGGGVRVRHDGMRAARRRGRLPADARHAADPRDDGPVRRRARRVSRNVEHVRLKESDRVVSMLQLNRMGGDVELVGDELVVAASTAH